MGDGLIARSGLLRRERSAREEKGQGECYESQNLDGAANLHVDVIRALVAFP